MVRYRRNLVPGGTFFFTVTVSDRRSRVLTDRVVELRAAFREVWRKRPFIVDAIVVLPDHLHTIFTLPHGDADFSSRWRDIKAAFNKTAIASGIPLVRRTNGEYALWQRRFWEHTIWSETDLARHLDYIHFNPVKHRLVTCVRDWPYSSFHRFVRQGLLPLDWAGNVDDDEASFGEP
jgi:REP-associated tyrosine transposase